MDHGSGGLEYFMGYFTDGYLRFAQCREEIKIDSNFVIQDVGVSQDEVHNVTNILTVLHMCEKKLSGGAKSADLGNFGNEGNL